MKEQLFREIVRVTSNDVKKIESALESRLTVVVSAKKWAEVLRAIAKDEVLGFASLDALSLLLIDGKKWWSAELSSKLWATRLSVRVLVHGDQLLPSLVDVWGHAAAFEVSEGHYRQSVVEQQQDISLCFSTEKGAPLQ